MQSHAFHLAFTTVIGLAAYQAVIALARNSEDFDTWDGVLMTGANIVLLFPILAIPMIFGGLRSRTSQGPLSTCGGDESLRPAPEYGCPTVKYVPAIF